MADQARLALVVVPTGRRKDGRLAVAHRAAIVGVAETTLGNAIREARRVGLVAVEERRAPGFRTETSGGRIVSSGRAASLRLGCGEDDMK